MTLHQAIETARAKAADSPRWIRAIDRAAAGLQGGELCVTLLSGCALVTSPNGSYRVNGACCCKAAQNGHRECYHRAAVRLTEMMETETAPAPAPVPTPRIVRSIERDITSNRRLRVTRVDGWLV